MKAKINGKIREIPDGINLGDLVASLRLKPDMVIAELNERVVKRNRWHDTILADGDTVELVSFVGGG